MWLPVVLLLATHLLVPAWLVFRLWAGRDSYRLDWAIKTSYTGAFILYLFLAGRWDWLSCYLRFAWIGLLVVAAVASYRRMRRAPWLDARDGGQWLTRSGSFVLLLIFLGALGFSVRGHLHQGPEGVRLAFPLQDGRYYVAQGGASLLLNHHHRHRAQRYAVDVVELNALGARARGIYPRRLESYGVFAEPVSSPCSGVVERVVGHLPDLAPPETDPGNPAGNHVVIACRGVEVVLAHLRSGSVAVKPGESVSTGQRIARVGNSGNSTEPHLHLHAVRAPEAGRSTEAEGVPMLISGKRPVRNTVFAM